MEKRNRRAAMVWGGLAGICNGLFGAGAGMVLAPGLQRHTDLDDQCLFPTVLAIVLPLSLVSLTVYGLHGDLPWSSAWPYLVGSTLGGLLSGTLGKRIPAKWLHRAMGVILLLGAVRALW